MKQSLETLSAISNVEKWFPPFSMRFMLLGSLNLMFIISGNICKVWINNRVFPQLLLSGGINSLLLIHWACTSSAFIGLTSIVLSWITIHFRKIPFIKLKIFSCSEFALRLLFRHNLDYEITRIYFEGISLGQKLTKTKLDLGMYYGELQYVSMIMMYLLDMNKSF